MTRLQKSLLTKYLLLFTALALFFAGAAVVYLFIQGSAYEPEEEPLRLQNEGASSTLHNQYQNELEQEQRETEEILAAAEETLQLNQSHAYFRLENRMQALADNYHRFWQEQREQELDLVRQEQDQELQQYARGSYQQAQEEINARQQEVNDRLKELEQGLTAEEVELIQDLRSQLLSEYRAELLNLRVKLRALELAPTREIQLKARLDQIESQVEAEVARRREEVETRLNQEVAQEARELQEEFIAFQQARIEQAEQDITQKEAQLNQELEELAEELAVEVEEDYQDYLQARSNEIDWLADNFQYFRRELE
ncbi:MAG: hypothetical protein ACQEQG_06155 [Bacillota bacterium]